jgi:hypothetical protein
LDPRGAKGGFTVVAIARGPPFFVMAFARLDRGIVRATYSSTCRDRWPGHLSRMSPV